MQTTKHLFKKLPLALAMMIIATGQVGVSIYLPSLPLISQDLNISATNTQFIVTFFLLGFGASQLFYGPFSDAIGRRPVFLLGQSIYLLGTLICVLSTNNFNFLVFGRLLQGLGAGSASVLGRSVIRDSYHGIQLTQAMSYLSVTTSILPILAPRCRWLGCFAIRLARCFFFSSYLSLCYFCTWIFCFTRNNALYRH